MDITLIFNKDKESFNLNKEDASRYPFSLFYAIFSSKIAISPLFSILFYLISRNNHQYFLILAEKKIIPRKQRFQVFSMENEEH